MAAPPVVPSSFTPHPDMGSPRRTGFDFIGAFSFLSYGFLLVCLLAAGAVFAYQWYLSTEEIRLQDELQTAQKKINESDIEEITRLDGRLDESRTLLNNHIILSKAFKMLEGLLPTTVRFTSLILTADAGVGGSVAGDGEAVSLNALAVLSATIGKDPNFRDPVFSQIRVTDDGTVTFAVSASINPTLLAFRLEAPPPATTTSALPEATSTSSGL